MTVFFVPMILLISSKVEDLKNNLSKKNPETL